MNLSFQAKLAGSYRSPVQRVRVLSEDWVRHQIYCPSCGQPEVDQYCNNRPVADFFCSYCKEDFELKSQGKTFGTKIVDGAYRTMMERLRGSGSPNLLLLHYDPSGLSVVNLFVVPGYFFVPQIIEERRPLSPFARRAGWIGCNILLHRIPHAGRIFVIRNGVVKPKEEVLAKWKKTLFIRDQNDIRAKSWILSIIKCIDMLDKNMFTIEDLYQYESDLSTIHPSNHHIRAKIRQKLQILRDKGYLDFIGNGTYRLTTTGIT